MSNSTSVTPCRIFWTGLMIMLRLQLCFRRKAKLANCLQPHFPMFIHSRGLYWYLMWLQVFILFKGNRPTSVLQTSYINSHLPVAVWVPSHWQPEPLPLSSHPRSEWLEGKSWSKLFFDEQVLSFRPSWNTQQDVASTKSFSELSLCRGRVIGNKNTGPFKSWRGCCQETFPAGPQWKQTTQLPRTLFRSPRSNCVNIF